MGLNRRGVRRRVNKTTNVGLNKKVEELGLSSIMIEQANKEKIDDKKEVVEEVIEEPIKTPPEPNDEPTEVSEEIEVTDDMVICLDTLEVYKDNKEAGEKTDATATGVKRCCNGTAKTSGKLRWQYYKDYLKEK